jgi:hypothetical protein
VAEAEDEAEAEAEAETESEAEGTAHSPSHRFYAPRFLRGKDRFLYFLLEMVMEVIFVLRLA